MARATFVKSARNDNPAAGIKKGDSYYWWAFRSGRSSRKMFSKTKPKRSQLTQSSFKGQIYDLEDSISELNVESFEALEAEVESIVGDLESLRDECQDSLDSMPEALQESSILNERIEALDSAIDEFNSLDFSYDEPDDDEVKEQMDLEDGEEPTSDEIEEQREVMPQDALTEKLGEVQDISIDCG